MAHAQIRCHQETKSKVRPKKKYARVNPVNLGGTIESGYEAQIVIKRTQLIRRMLS